jgi:lysyl-tRNA synthetase class 2
MDLTEDLFKFLANKVLGNTKIEYQDQVYDFAKPFTRLTFKQAIQKYNPKLSISDLEEHGKLYSYIKTNNIAIAAKHPGDLTIGDLQCTIFDQTVEEHLLQPTFITEYPIEISPLARRSDLNPGLTDRFELFIAGREIANAFSELNDPLDQKQRFQEQASLKDAGDLEAMHYDHDYVTALEYGLPPTAGEGIGIDRLVMLFTNQSSIRDVLLFPHMRPVE